MTYTTTQLVQASENLFQGHRPTVILEQLNQMFYPALMKKRYLRRELKNVIYITPHMSPIHRNGVIQYISNVMDRMILITPNRVNCHWMKLMFNSTDAVCIFDRAPADIRGIRIRQEWLALTFGIDQAHFADAWEGLGNFGSIANSPASVPLAPPEAGGDARQLFELVREEVIDQSKPRKTRQSASDITKQQRKSRERVPKPETKASLEAAEAEINQEISNLRTQMKKSTSELQKLKHYKAIRSLQSKRSQYRRHYKSIAN